MAQCPHDLASMAGLFGLFLFHILALTSRLNFMSRGNNSGQGNMEEIQKERYEGDQSALRVSV